jgi:RNA polymerase sigma-70 factor (ECF subfamily)
VARFETSLGGEGRGFPSTRWSLIRAARDPRAPEYREAIDHLCRLYWKPVYAFIRATRPFTVEESKDVCQDFFVELMEGNMLGRYAPERGSFRGYLRGAIRLFLLERHQQASAQKRGGGRTILSMDESIDVPSGQGPEDAFDLQWARSAVDHALADLREELTRGGKELYYRVLDRYDLNPPAEGAPTYAALARELGLKETDVSNYLVHARSRLRALLTARIRDYVAEEAEVQPELARIFDLLTGGRH